MEQDDRASGMVEFGGILVGGITSIEQLYVR